MCACTSDWLRAGTYALEPVCAHDHAVHQQVLPRKLGAGSPDVCRGGAVRGIGGLFRHGDGIAHVLPVEEEAHCQQEGSKVVLVKEHSGGEELLVWPARSSRLRKGILWTR